MVLEANREEWWLLGGSEWAVTGKGHQAVFQGTSQCSVLPLSVGYSVVLVLQNFFKLYIYDLCTALCILYINKRIILQKSYMGKLEPWRQVTQRGRLAQGRMTGRTSGLASLVKPCSFSSGIAATLGDEMYVMEIQRGTWSRSSSAVTRKHVTSLNLRKT